MTYKSFTHISNAPAVDSELQEFLFRGIQKQEWNNIFSFLQAKRIRIENLEEAQQGPGGNAPLDFSGLDLGEDIDTGRADTLFRPPRAFLCGLAVVGYLKVPDKLNIARGRVGSPYCYPKSLHSRRHFYPSMPAP